MCGIVGIFCEGEAAGFVDAVRLGCQQISHRGPDDSGVWCEGHSPVALGHVRLSILDLSPAGHQPMRSACGRFVIVFNGEIYNHLELRRQLESAGSAPDWRGHSDTETLLACISAWGMEATLKASVGMFALALWDRRENCLTLARDRFGEKPLYYGYVGNSLAFASEMKALKILPGFTGEIDRGALALMMRYNNVPAPYCIYRGLRKLEPGTWLNISLACVRQADLPEPVQYWSARQVAEQGVLNPLAFDSDHAATDALEGTLKQAIAGQMLSDVPLGAFLSGGVDSSAIVALMQAQSSVPVRTFTIGFDEGAYDEARFAKEVARHIGTDHTELHVSAEDALSVIPLLPTIYDEPFADSSQIPTYLVAKLTRQHVTVALSGDGGDELFAGYNRYVLAARQWNRISAIPLPLRRILAGGIRSVSPEFWNRLYQIMEPLCPARFRVRSPALKLQKTAGALTSCNKMELYKNLVTHWDPQRLVLDSREPDVHCSQLTEFPGLIEEMMFLDTVSYLPNDILVKVDRAAMANSLETRVPFLNHEVFEFAWRLPVFYKIRDGVGKWLLRQVLYRHVPQNLIERPKAGFGIPLDMWLRGPLRDWAEELLAENRLKTEGFFSPEAIRFCWHEHLSGKRNWHHQLWCVLMFQAWSQVNEIRS